MAEKQYNYIYRHLVSSPEDLIGLLAYSIYKQHKIEFIEDFKKKKGCAPTDADIEGFIMSSVTPSQLEKYKESANTILSETVADAVQDEMERMSFDFQNAIEPVVKKHSSSWFKTVLLNVLGSFVFSIILVIIFLFGYTTENNLRNKTKAVVETIQGIQTDSTQIKK